MRLYLRYGYVPSPYTIYRRARKLAPGHYLLCENGNTTISRYWDPVAFAITARSLDVEDAQAELDALLSTAVRERQIADVPLGAFLSGGIDSSVVVALMQEQSATPVKTFTIRFDNPEYNEADHAAAVARHLRTDHYEQTCSEAELLGVIDTLPGMFDEPFADSSAVPTYLVSKIARAHVTVALSGDGGDELFLGYPRHRYYETGAWALDMPRPIRRTAAWVASSLPTRRLRRIADVFRDEAQDRYARFVTWWPQEDIVALTGAEAGEPPLYTDARERSAGLDAGSHAGLLDLVSYLPEDILTKVDRTSMAVSLEARAPLLDHRVVEFALRLPHDLKRRGATSKYLLRRVLYTRVPPALVDRPKMGFGVPLAEWLKGPLRPTMDAYCGGSALEELGIEPRPVRQLYEAFKAGRAHRADLMWQIYALVSWARRCHTPVGTPRLANECATSC